ncbi:hypothetical protein GCM10022393_38950 [Aquimarina addita]|uniref:LysM domain-containing protein n=1 Tax=Aquimarina addita TaxID=870485 RepID=A0ABP6UWP2_9FLAO
MFFNKIKHVIHNVLGCSLYLACITVNTVQSQSLDKIEVEDIKIIDQRELVIDGNIVYLPIYNRYHHHIFESSVHTISDARIKNEVFTSNWNTAVFNTFWNQKLSYPFQLHFEDEAFSSPVDHNMVVTSRYGWRRGRPHQGIDIDLVTGDNVKAILGGKVRYARTHGGHGKTIVIRHYNGLETVYAHLSKYEVKENEIVEKGQVIGKGGVSGNARGSHLHLEVRYKGESIHPEYLFDFTNDTKVRSQDIVVTKKWATVRSHTSKKQSNIIIHTSIEDINTEDTASVKKIHIVKKGDTLYGIANKNDVPVSEICKLNEIPQSSVLNIGQEILLY